MKPKTLKDVLLVLRKQLADATHEDELDQDKLTEADNSFNLGWQMGMQNAINILNDFANEYVKDKLD